MRSRLFLAASAAVVSLTLAVPALAGDNGEGLAGETDDKLVTFFSLGVLAFFLSVVIVGSAIQGRLEKRKQEKQSLALRRSEGP